MSIFLRARPRFSLRTLVIFLLLATSAMGLWWHWGPWPRAAVMAVPDESGGGLIWHGRHLPEAGRVLVTPSGASLRGTGSWWVLLPERKAPVFLCDPTTGRAVAEIAEPDWHWSVEVSPDGRRIALAGPNERCRIVDALTGEVLASAGPGPARPPEAASAGSLEYRSVQWLPDGKRVLTKTSRQRLPAPAPKGFRSDKWEAVPGTVISLWDSRTGDLVASREMDGYNARLGLSPRGKLLAAWSRADERGEVHILDAGSLETVATVDAGGTAVEHVAWRPDGRHLVTACQNGRILISDARSGGCLRGMYCFTAERREALPLGTRELTAAGTSPDGTRLVAFCVTVVLGMRGMVQVWDLAGGRRLSKTDIGDDWAYSFHFSPDGDLVACHGGSDGVYVFDVRSGEHLNRLGGHKPFVLACGFWQGGSLLWVTAQPPTFETRVWDPRSGECLVVLDGRYRHRSDDGLRLLTNDASGCVSVWDAGTYARLAAIPTGGGSWTNCRFLPGGDRIIVSAEGAAPAIYRRSRPERWWGVFALWELWLTVLFAGVFVWSLLNDRRRLAPAAPAPSPPAQNPLAPPGGEI